MVLLDSTNAAQVAAKSGQVSKTSSTNIPVGGAEHHFLRSYDELFATWFHDKEVSEAILAKLRKDFIANKKILISYDDFRTRKTFSQVLDGWLDTKTLDDVINAVSTSATGKYARMHATFSEWHKNGITTDQVSKALSKITNENKAKTYTMIDNLYKAFVRHADKAT
ncbi:hypothetical protein ON010_g1850 [Phytophthora cinnamomi]|nr:hypothetical protein ON010_g1850 [Phytophthora cinnamomi]